MSERLGEGLPAEEGEEYELVMRRKSLVGSGEATGGWRAVQQQKRKAKQCVTGRAGQAGSGSKHSRHKRGSVGMAA